MCKKSIPIITVGLSVVAAMLVLGYVVFVKPKLGKHVQVPEVNNTADTIPTPENNTVSAPDDASIPTPTPNDSRVEDNKTIKNYKLDCTSKPDNFQTKYSWYIYFKEQIIENWLLDTVCYNSELNKLVYLKSKIDWENYIYDSSKTSYGFSQLGIYDIEKDKYNEAPIKDLGFYEGCGIIKEWKKNNEIIYQCGTGDAGIGATNIFSYNAITKTMRLIEKCEVQAGREPEEICTKIKF